MMVYLRELSHTDCRSLIIPSSGGNWLQVKSDGEVSEWVDVPFLKNSCIFNLENRIKSWTNARFKSTLHQEISPPKDGRNHQIQYIALFLNINGDAEVLPIKTCVNENYPKMYNSIL